jgi:hypothetical protein
MEVVVVQPPHLAMVPVKNEVRGLLFKSIMVKFPNVHIEIGHGDDLGTSPCFALPILTRGNDVRGEFERESNLTKALARSCRPVANSVKDSVPARAVRMSTRITTKVCITSANNVVLYRHLRHRICMDVGQ